MSKHIHIITLSILALSFRATAGTETAQQNDLINSLEGTCLPNKFEALVHKINEQEKKAEELYRKRYEDRTANQRSLEAMIAFRDFGVSLEQTMPQSLKPVYSPILEELHYNSNGRWSVYCHELKYAWQKLEQLAILQEKTLDDLSSLTPEQQNLAQKAISLHKIAQENNHSASYSAWEKANAKKQESLKELCEKLTQVDGNDTSLEKTDASMLAHLADHALQSSCKTGEYECPKFINTYLAARKAFIQANLEHKTNQQ